MPPPPAAACRAPTSPCSRVAPSPPPGLAEELGVDREHAGRAWRVNIKCSHVKSVKRDLTQEFDEAEEAARRRQQPPPAKRKKRGEQQEGAQKLDNVLDATSPGVIYLIEVVEEPMAMADQQQQQHEQGGDNMAALEEQNGAGENGGGEEGQIR